MLGSLLKQRSAEGSAGLEGPRWPPTCLAAGVGGAPLFSACGSDRGQRAFVRRWAAFSESEGGGFGSRAPGRAVVPRALGHTTSKSHG